jgi:hypothetical protein
MSMEIAYLKTQADDALACARRLAEKAQADGRHLSYAEQTAFDRKMADARRYAEQIKQHRGDEAARDEDHDVGLAGGHVHRRLRGAGQQ